MKSCGTSICRTLILGACVIAWMATPLQAQQPEWDPNRPDPAYTLTRVAGGAVLVHNPTGDAWWLLIEKGTKSKKTRATWLPINRVEDYGQVARWLLAQNSDSTRSIVDIEIAFAKDQLKQARTDYGPRHPEVIKLSQDLRSLEKVKRAFEKQRAARKKAARASEAGTSSDSVEKDAA